MTLKSAIPQSTGIGFKLVGFVNHLFGHFKIGLIIILKNDSEAAGCSDEKRKRLCRKGVVVTASNAIARERPRPLTLPAILVGSRAIVVLLRCYLQGIRERAHPISAASKIGSVSPTAATSWPAASRQPRPSSLLSFGSRYESRPQRNVQSGCIFPRDRVLNIILNGGEDAIAVDWCRELYRSPRGGSCWSRQGCFARWP